MLQPEQEKFIAWWKENREHQKTSIRPLLVGLSAGLVLGISLIIAIATDWDKRATMEAHSKLSSGIFVLAIIILSVVMGFLYRNYRWEMQEQQYLELLAKKNAENSKEKQPS